MSFLPATSRCLIPRRTHSAASQACDHVRTARVGSARKAWGKVLAASVLRAWDLVVVPVVKVVLAVPVVPVVPVVVSAASVTSRAYC